MSAPNQPAADLRERLARWDKYRIEQLTFALNLFLGLSVGALAYGVALVREDGFALPPRPKKLLFIGLIALAVSTLTGCIAVVSRWLDFKYTAKKLRADGRNETTNSKRYRGLNKFFGTLTKVLFAVELLGFLIGLLGLIVGLYARYGYRLN
jgi:hypothetical protein